MDKNALIVVDMQNDFIHGSLKIKDAYKIVHNVNKLLSLSFDYKIATQDWHPKEHVSFASTWKKKPGECIMMGDFEQKLWFDHCIQGTAGAEFEEDVDVNHFDFIVHKGTRKEVDSYSTFFDNQKLHTTGLEAYLRNAEVKDLFFCGLATDYCVLYSVIDAKDLGFRPYVVYDACCGIGLKDNDIDNAISIMKSLGAEFLTVTDLEKRLKKK